MATNECKGKHKRQQPSDNTVFEMLIRKNPELDDFSRGCWLEAALSHNKGYSFATQSWKAEQIGVILRRWQAIEKRILATGFFKKGKRRGVHGARKLHRDYLPNETSSEEWVERFQAYDGLDIALGLHWVACSRANEDGIAEFSARSIWNVSMEALRQARRKMDRLGYFQVKSDRGTGKPAIYIRINQVIDEQQTAETRSLQQKKDQLKKRQEEAQEAERSSDIGYQERQKQEAILAHQHEVADAVGINIDGSERTGITGTKNPPKKEVHRPHPLFKKSVRNE